MTIIFNEEVFITGFLQSQASEVFETSEAFSPKPYHFLFRNMFLTDNIAVQVGPTCFPVAVAACLLEFVGRNGCYGYIVVKLAAFCNDVAVWVEDHGAAVL